MSTDNGRALIDIVYDHAEKIIAHLHYGYKIEDFFNAVIKEIEADTGLNHRLSTSFALVATSIAAKDNPKLLEFIRVKSQRGEP